MATENGAQVQYYLEMDTDFLHMNQLLNTTLELSFKKFELAVTD